MLWVMMGEEYRGDHTLNPLGLGCANVLYPCLKILQRLVRSSRLSILLTVLPDVVLQSAVHAMESTAEKVCAAPAVLHCLKSNML